jgi:O-acetyl-ADP-ribose deacetylase
MEFTIVQGDIASESADALVNAAGTSLRMGSGVAGALERGGGEALAEAALDAGPIDLGSVAVTDAYELDAEWVIHAAAMPHYGDRSATAESIREATRASLTAADERGCRSVVLPALGCGVAGFNLEEGVAIIAEAIDRFEGVSLTDTRIIGYSKAEYETIESAAATVRAD